MIISPTAAPVATVSYASAASEDCGPVKSATSKKEPAKDRFSVFHFDQRVFSWEGGKYFLRLREDPILILDPATVRMSVKDWGMELNVGSAAQLPKHIVRRFLLLWSKAQENLLDDKEAESWAAIVGLVDMENFALQQSVPRYVEGQLVALRDVLRVKWHDGILNYIPREFNPAFDLLEEGEHFSAYVKFGPSGVPIVIDRVVPLPAPIATSAVV